ncbi:MULTISPECIES: thiamine phosphate synthase [Thalassospira]|uniref:thiamine phosphate synthase n=1 Tax=Thalassospira TaxID=168934 RepID=UPI0008DCE517|nr:MULTISPECIES: thiamine phosphate synthase [Thalassospira]MAB34227.1 thiamine phosphate synthase [Thalassospira sp.]MDM7978252.1 thiamine phosphate synthase [Thalassospira xiamenensis]OHZ03400.1 thiamine-phosphate diphosphorylase [Thalassospira sp. MIT1004]HBS24224.1 thiamine phosphate synthase [Thalassospira sp.]|tara:strand:+ start:75 stop:725 length:651 start_codon:yes stop_codon:yes gene_type:complete
MTIVNADDQTGLYLLTPPKIDLAVFPDLLKSVLDTGAIDCLQLRLKDVSDDEIRKAIDAILPLCSERDIPLILNDRPDIAKKSGADGVHVGEEDASYAEARAIMGEEHIVGVSCYDSRHRAMELGEKGADYVAFGAFYPTQTKEAKTSVTPEIIEIWTTFTTVPCVAIGGITADNLGPIVEAGADFIAVTGGVWNHPDGPEAGAKAIKAAIAAASD